MGAPFEGPGKVYIYHSSAEGLQRTPSQVWTPPKKNKGMEGGRGGWNPHFHGADSAPPPPRR